tara:strand:- start:120 stop:251 length:132 start_codon:yes stop_codon:yes gene_type:complete
MSEDKTVHNFSVVPDEYANKIKEKGFTIDQKKSDEKAKEKKGE